MKTSVVLLHSSSPHVLQIFYRDLQIKGISRCFCSDCFSIDNLSNYDCCIFDLSNEPSKVVSFVEKLKSSNFKTFALLLVAPEMFSFAKESLVHKKSVTILKFPAPVSFLKKYISSIFGKSSEPDSSVLAVENDRACEIENSGGKFDSIIGTSKAISELKQKLIGISHADETVLLEGESGTGKTFIARLMHENSLRANQPFIAVNSAAIPETLAESELMGSVHGGYTDAGNRAGYFEQADKGTLFLDEISELSLFVQSKLLKLCEDSTLYRIGSNKQVNYNVRLLCATNADLKTLVNEKRFRQDLYYRISVLKLEIPPLRERIEDIPLLAEHFLKGKAETRERYFSPDAVDLLLSHKWPGNIRELKNCIYRAVSLSSKDIITSDFITF